MSELYIGIDLGGTNTKAGCFDSELNLLAKESISTEAEKGPGKVVEKMAQAAQMVVKSASCSMDQVQAVGFGAPGPVSLKEGLVVSAPNLPGFNNTPIRDMLSQALARPCVMENDANAAAWGEFVAGAAEDVNDMIFFTLGTGIGGGVVCNNKIVHGSVDDAAELGHLIIFPDGGRTCGCGQRGCAEAYASASSTAARANERLACGAESTLQNIYKAKGSVTSRDVFEHAEQGDYFADSVVDLTAKVLALLCVNLVHTTGPQRVVFAGGMIAAGDFLLNKIKAHYKAQMWDLNDRPLEICFATLGEDAGIIGCAALAKQG